MTYIFQRGETVGISLALVSGDFADVSAITAAMKPVAAGRSGVDGATPAIPLWVTADGEDGWILTLDAVACATRCGCDHCGNGARRDGIAGGRP